MTKIGQIIQEEIEAACAEAAMTAAAARAETAAVRAEAATTARAEKNNIAKNLLRKGMDISDISECTGLARADVERLLLN